LQSFMKTLLAVRPEGSCMVVTESFCCHAKLFVPLFAQKSLEGSVVKPCQLVLRALYLSDLAGWGQLCVTCVGPYFGFGKGGARNSRHVQTVRCLINKNYSILILIVNCWTLRVLMCRRVWSDVSINKYINIYIYI
jgi:hypothetical protein